MKHSENRWATFIAAVGVLTLISLGVPAAIEAQTTGLRVAIPFEFNVGDHVLPPGSYSLWLNGSGHALSVSDGKGQLAVSMTNAVKRQSARNAADSLLIFSLHGNRYFLNEVRWAGYAEARSLFKSRTETEFAKAIGGPKLTITTIAAK